MMNGLYNSGDAASRSGVSSKMIRHYESIGLLPVAARTASNYRVYSETDVHQLRFIKRARDLGFSIRQIGQLVGLWQSSNRSSAEVRALAQEHVTEMDAKIREMQEMRDALAALVARCQGGDQPSCPILESLAEEDCTERPAHRALSASTGL